MPLKSLKILIIDDEKVICDFLAKLFSVWGIEAYVCSNGYQAVEAVRENRFDAAFIDWRMQGMDGAETLHMLKEICPAIKGVIMTGYPREDVLRDLDVAKFKGDVIIKPFDIGKIRELVDKFALNK